MAKAFYEVKIVGRRAPEGREQDLGCESIGDVHVPATTVDGGRLLNVRVAKRGHQSEEWRNGDFGLAGGVEVNAQEQIVLRLEKLPHRVLVNSIVLLKQEAGAAVHAPTGEIEAKLECGMVDITGSPKALALAKV